MPGVRGDADKEANQKGNDCMMLFLLGAAAGAMLAGVFCLCGLSGRAGRDERRLHRGELRRWLRLN